MTFKEFLNIARQSDAYKITTIECKIHRLKLEIEELKREKKKLEEKEINYEINY